MFTKAKLVIISDKVFVKNTIMLYIMTVIKYVSPFIISACLTRRLGPSVYGEMIYVSTMMGYFMSILDFGFNYSSTRKIAEHKNNKEYVSKILTNTVLAKCVISIPCILCFLLMIINIDLIKKNLLLSVIYFINSLIHIFLPDFVYRGLEKMEFVTIRYGISKFVSAILILILVDSEKKVILVPIIYCIGSIIAIIWANLNLRNGFKIYYEKRSSIHNAVKEIYSALGYFISVFASTSFSAIISITFGLIDIPASDIACWNIALQIVIAMQSLYDPITSSLFPRVVVEKNCKKVIRITVYLSIFVLLGCIIVFCNSDLIIRIIAGTGYEKAAFLLRIFTPLLFFSFPAQMLGFPLLGAMGKVNYVTRSTVISACILLLLVVFFWFNKSINIISLVVIRDVTEFLYFIIRFIFAYFFIKNA